nr:uncharacterized protein LOC109173053 [Ipomoea trifida]
MKQLSSSTVIGKKRKVSSSSTQDFNPTEEQHFGPWLRAPNRRPSPVTGNRWVVSDEPIRNTTTNSFTHGQEVAADTSAVFGRVQKDKQCTPNPTFQHVSNNTCTHPTISVPIQDAAMEPVDTPENGLVIADQKQRSSVVNTTIRNTTPNSILGEPYESRTSERPKFKGKQQLVTGSPNLPSFGKMNNTPRSSLNMTLGSDKAIPLSDITNCSRIRQRKKIKGALEVTVASRLENNVNVSPRNYNTQSYFLENSTTNIPQESNTQGIICRDLSQDFDEVIENEGCDVDGIADGNEVAAADGSP